MSIILLPPYYFVVNKAGMTQNRDPNGLFGTINSIKMTLCDMYLDLLKYTTW